MIKMIMALIVITSLMDGCRNEKVVERGKTVFVEPDVEPPPLGDPQPNYIAEDEAEAIMLLDAATLNATDALETFYVVGCNTYNEGTRELDEMMDGINKGLNSLSTERGLEIVTPVGDQGCIWRVDQEAYGISKSEYQRIERNLTLQFVPDTVRNRTLQAILQKLRPWIHASDFFLTTYQADAITQDNGLFYDLTEQPIDIDGFFQERGITLQEQFDRQRVVCAGGDDSKIALGKDRLTCIVEADDGPVMSTYDVDLATPDTVTENFATREMAITAGIGRVFAFNAQEHLYQLPNGLWQGRLNGANGHAETFAPASIVADREQDDVDVQIRPGACFNCHANTIAIPFDDDVYEHVRRTGFNTAEKNAAEAFFSPDKFQGQLNTINAEYRDNLQRIGVDPAARDPMVNAVIRPMRGQLSIERVAAYVWMPLEEFKVCLQGADQSSIALGDLLNGATVTLADLSDGFNTLVLECGAYRDRGQIN